MLKQLANLLFAVQIAFRPALRDHIRAGNAKPIGNSQTAGTRDVRIMRGVQGPVRLVLRIRVSVDSTKEIQPVVTYYPRSRKPIFYAASCLTRREVVKLRRKANVATVQGRQQLTSMVADRAVQASIRGLWVSANFWGRPWTLNRYSGRIPGRCQACSVHQDGCRATILINLSEPASSNGGTFFPTSRFHASNGDGRKQRVRGYLVQPPAGSCIWWRGSTWHAASDASTGTRLVMAKCLIA